MKGAGGEDHRIRSQKEREGGSAFLHKKMQNNIYLIVSNQAHEHIRQKGSISNQKQSKQI